MPGASRESILAPFGSAWPLFWLHFGSPWRPFGLFGSVPAEGSRKWMRLSVLVRDWSVLGPAWGVLGSILASFGLPWAPFWLPFGATFATFWRSGSASIYGPPLLMFSVPYWAPFWDHFGVDFRCQSGVKINKKNNSFWDAILKGF